MFAKSEILFAGCDAAAENLVLRAFEDLPTIPARLKVCTGVEELEQELEQGVPRLALLDVDGLPGISFEKVEALTRRFPAMRLLTVCEALRTDLVLQAMQAGARHCMEKKAIVEQLPALVVKFFRETQGSYEPSGSLVTVLSAGGGCGGTTLAINLAEELGLQTGDPTLLVDMDQSYGAVAAYLGIDGKYGLGDVLADRSSIDPQLILSTASVLHDKLHVLLSPASVDFANPSPVPPDNLDRALDACREAYRFTVLDAPRVTMTTAANLAHASAATIIVFELAVVDVRTARAMLDALVERQVPREKVVAVANRFHRRHAMLRLDDARAALGSMDVVTLRNDFDSAQRSINLGKPLSKVAPRSALRKDVRALVDALLTKMPKRAA